MRTESRRGWMTWLLVANMDRVDGRVTRKRWHTDAFESNDTGATPSHSLHYIEFYGDASSVGPRNKRKRNNWIVRANRSNRMKWQNIRNILVGGVAAAAHNMMDALIKMFHSPCIRSMHTVVSDVLCCFQQNNVNGCAPYSVEMHRGGSDT